MLRVPFVATWSLAEPGPLRRRLGGKQGCLAALEDGRLMVFNPLNPRKNGGPWVQIRSPKPSEPAPGWAKRGLRETRRQPFCRPGIVLGFSAAPWSRLTAGPNGIVISCKSHVQGAGLRQWQGLWDGAGAQSWWGSRWGRQGRWDGGRCTVPVAQTWAPCYSLQGAHIPARQ